MTYRSLKSRWWQVVLGATLLVVLLGQAAWAQTREDFNKLHNRCWELIRAGRYQEAERLGRQLIEWAEGPLQDEPQVLADACNTLGTVYWNQAQYAQAEPLYKRALAIRQKVLGPEHPDVAESLHNLAALYDAQGRFAEAEPLLKRALELVERPEAKPETRYRVFWNYAELLWETDRRSSDWAWARASRWKTSALSSSSLATH